LDDGFSETSVRFIKRFTRHGLADPKKYGGDTLIGGGGVEVLKGI
jgi:hypothetical protein